MKRDREHEMRKWRWVGGKERRKSHGRREKKEND